MRHLLLIIAVLALIGCAQTATPKQDSAFATEADIRYFKDSRVNLCYATVATSNGHFGYIVSIANVPCEKVEALIK